MTFTEGHFPLGFTIDPDTDYIHVYPTFGREHVLDGLCCWCRPQPDEECDTVIIHRVFN